MFSFAPVGGAIALAGIIFMLTVGWKLVKVRKQSAGLELFDVEKYLFELKITAESGLLDQSVGELKDQLSEEKMDLISLIHKRETKSAYSDQVSGDHPECSARSASGRDCHCR